MPETLEAEIIEIDGKAPPPPAPEPGSPWTRTRARVVRLDRRWWPLWVVLGTAALILAATVGLVFGAIYLIFAMLRAGLRLVFGSGSGR